MQEAAVEDALGGDLGLAQRVVVIRHGLDRDR
jgi:hypothetical protein